MRKTVLIGMVLLFATTVFAQHNIGVDYFYLGEYDKAKAHLTAEKASANNNFFLGEIALAEGDTEKAKNFYTEGLTLDPTDALNQIGLLKITWNADPKNNEKVLNTLLKKNKKNIEATIAAGYFYLSMNQHDKAMEKVKAARKINSKYPKIYILEGDILAAQSATKGKGEIGSKYEMSIYFDPNFCLGYVKYATIYEKINSTLAIEQLKKAIEKHPEYIIAYGYIGQLYTQNGFYPKAIEAYQKYFQAKEYRTRDAELYVRSLYFSAQYDVAKEIIQEELKTKPDHFILNRFLMYIAAKTNDATNGTETAQKFFNIPLGTNHYIPTDYTIYASILNTAGRYLEALAQFDKAIEMEPDNMDLYSEAARMAKDRKDFGTSAHYQTRIMDKKADIFFTRNYPDYVVDENLLGIDYYSAGTQIARNPKTAEILMKHEPLTSAIIASNPNIHTDSLTSNVKYFTKQYSKFYLEKAIVVFDTLVSRQPEIYSGYRFRALSKHALNPSPEQGPACSDYLEVVRIITQREEMSAVAKNNLIEAYSYLGYHYYMISDVPNTILYWNKVLELDPENAKAKAVLEAMEKEKKK